ncbi:MAG: N-acetylmuramic acid 6-phosphate etherase [Jatrophihabitans sp.]
MVMEMVDPQQDQSRDPAPAELDLLDTGQAVRAVLAGQAQVHEVVRGAQREISRAVDLLVAAYQRGGRLLLLGAGTSGRLAVQEAVEVPGTYGIPAARIQARVAGGGAGHLVGTDEAEDDTELGRADVASLGAGPADALIAVAASGRTPYTCAAAAYARELGAGLVTVTNLTGSQLAALADVAIEVPVGVEVVAGSTRLAAGTAQKLVLNTLTTATMIRLGRVHGNHMVDVVAANDKLRGRISGVVAASAGCSAEQARAALQRCDWDARAAIVHLATGLEPAAAAARAAAHRTVRQAIDAPA